MAPELLTGGPSIEACRVRPAFALTFARTLQPLLCGQRPAVATPWANRSDLHVREPENDMTARRKAPALRTAAVPRPTVHLVAATEVVDLDWPADGVELRRVQQAAMEWSRVVRNRSRWVRLKARAQDQDVEAEKLMTALGVSNTQLKQLAAARTVRVAIPFTTEDEGWEARLLPWEFIISASTRRVRTGPVSVSRWLVRPDLGKRKAKRTVLFVESSPGRLADEWNFDYERSVVKGYAGAENFETLVSPTREQLKAKVRTMRPDVVHLAGFDNHQGLALSGYERQQDVHDGYLLAGSGGLDPVPAADLTALLTPDGHVPALVFCNLWNSGARISAQLVAAGVRAAVGFQDGVDDALAEIFTGSFYRGLAASKDDVDAAFQAGWDAARDNQRPLRGTGIVLWRGGPLAMCKSASTAMAAAPTKLQPSARSGATPVASPIASVADARRAISVMVEPEPQITYGLLHNDDSLFKSFIVRKLEDHPECDVDVTVTLHTNRDDFPFRITRVMTDPVWDVAPDVRIALTSSLARSLDEVLKTSLFVQVSCERFPVYCRTFPVTLDPVDLWSDTDDSRVFLPSFIFPRDRAVATIIKQAEQFGTALRDDPTAGFDGYQALDDSLPNPADHVDKQVQAIWYSLLYKVPASYINPPPTYAVASQRIRTPSEVVAGGFGTCIDLALALAACLEAVEIYPVVFLLNDHAFPGYWRTDAARADFCARVEKLTDRRDEPGPTLEPGAPASSGERVRSWSFGPPVIKEIRRAMNAQLLIPIETVGVTGRWRLADAIEEARGYFDDEQRFLVMLDVQTAREERVTPLPLGDRLLGATR